MRRGVSERLPEQMEFGASPGLGRSGMEPSSNPNAHFATAEPRPVYQSATQYTSSWIGIPASLPDRIFPKFAPSAMINIETPLEEYEYSVLAHNGFRLLQLHPGSDNTEISCSLLTVSEEPPPYAALSFCWGSDAAIDKIRITNSDGPAPGSTRIFKIKPSLYSALSSLRRNLESPMFLWADAICINQNDVKERSLQVQRMANIYSSAEKTIVWLDSGNADSEQAFPLISEILNIQGFDTVIEDKTRASQWNALAEIMKKKLWTRRWVMQEIALAKSARLYCGEKSLQWDDFLDAIKILVPRIDRISNLREHANFLSPDSSRRPLPAAAFIDATNFVLRKSRNGEILERIFTLESLVSRLVGFEADDPRDTIYTLLSLAKDHGVVADYRKDILDVYSEFVLSCVKTSGSLDIICRHWAYKPKKRIRHSKSSSDGLPSWIPDVRDSSFATYSDPNDTMRLHGDSLVGLPDWKRYNASYGTKAQAKIETPPEGSTWASPNSKILSVKGFRVTKINEVANRAIQGTIPGEWLEMGGWVPPELGYEASLPDGLWRTLVADRDTDGNQAPRWYRRACLLCLSTPRQDMDINTREWINSKTSPSLVVDFLKRVQSVIWNRIFFSAPGFNGKGFFGLGPAGAAKGDIVCILFGISVPVLLRKVQGAPDSYYRLVGEVYLDEMMDGQALQQWNEEDARIFRLL